MSADVGRRVPSTAVALASREAARLADTLVADVFAAAAGAGVASATADGNLAGVTSRVGLAMFTFGR